MSVKTKLSLHALKRVEGRTLLTEKETVEILNEEKVVLLGKENGNNRTHKLFYSIPDNNYFVAIQDVSDGTVVTILPVDFHENICWNISADTLEKAKKIMLRGSMHIEEYDDENFPDTVPENGPIFRVQALVADEYNRYLKHVKVCCWPREPYNGRIDLLVKDKKFANYLSKKTKQITKEINNGLSLIQCISIRVGNSGRPVFFSLDEICVPE